MLATRPDLNKWLTCSGCGFFVLICPNMIINDLIANSFWSCLYELKIGCSLLYKFYIFVDGIAIFNQLGIYS